jgi:electron transfer flavoprotein beta subunit
MHIVVCIKQVPDSAQIRVHPVTNTIMRQGVPAIVNPYDLFALEEALRLKDQFGGRVTMLCMGPPQAEDALRKCISFGADDAVLVTDRAFAGADTLATSYALAAAIRQIGQEQAVDLVFTGKQTIDGDTAQVGPGIAKRLGLQPAHLCVSASPTLDLERHAISVERRAEGGVQVLKTAAALPDHHARRHQRDALRHHGRHAARRPLPGAQVEQGAAGIEDVTKIGLKGSPTVVTSRRSCCWVPARWGAIWQAVSPPRCAPD